MAEPHIGVVGIEEPNRSPRVVPLWYDFDPEIGIWVLSRERSRKTALLRAAGKFSLCVQDTTPLAYKHVSVQGSIIEERRCDLERDFRPLVTRYLKTEAVEQFILESWDEERLIFLMRPEYWVTADYANQWVTAT